MRIGIKAFTIIEIALVISIIGTLATFATPSFKWYMDRGHDVEYQMIMKRQISLIEQYRVDNWWEVESPPGAYVFEIYCIPGFSGSTGCTDTTPDDMVHTGLTLFFNSSAEWLRSLSEITKIPFWEWYEDSAYIWLNKTTPAALNSMWWWFVIPWYDPLDNTNKIEFLYWWLPGWSGLTGDVRINNESLGILPDKRCAPGIAVRVAYESTMCMYIFGKK